MCMGRTSASGCECEPRIRCEYCLDSFEADDMFHEGPGMPMCNECSRVCSGCGTEGHQQMVERVGNWRSRYGVECGCAAAAFGFQDNAS